ncbi:MAG: endonuclease/exonuclease/phosphatase family protein [Bacteroidota bacterium]
MTEASKRRPLISSLTFALHVCIFLLALITVFSFFGQWSAVLELLCHFRMHYLGLWGLSGIWFVVTNRYRWIGLAILGMGMNAYQVFPLYWQENAIVPENSGSDTFTIASINVLQDNQNYQSVENYIRAKDPDIVALLEATPRWASGLRSISDEFPFQVLVPLPGYYGIILLSQFPIDSSKTLRLISPPVPSLYAQVRIGSQSLQMVVSHPPSPPSLKKIAWRNHMFLAIGRLMSEMEGHKLLIGDLNTTSYSTVFRSLLEQTGMRDSRIGWGRQASWPSRFGAWGIALDHALLSPDMEVLHRETGVIEGSDHKPIFLKLAIHQDGKD